ncbi:MAG: cyclic nucleotide-binding domain-containing protein [Planctomycetaceae bacterium]|nr:cyclic nucleotide-binding domain-containing protein [Planctomycetaceae bacterium]
MAEQQNQNELSRYIDLLHGCSLLGDLSEDELQHFLSLTCPETFQAGDEILEEDKVYQGLWIILEGECEVVKRGCNGRNRLATLDPGNVFGEMSFLQKAPHSASVKAINEVHTIRLLREKYDALLECCPTSAQKIAVNIVRVLSDRLRRMDDWTCELVDGQGDQKQHQEWHDFRSKLYSGLFE